MFYTLMCLLIIKVCKFTLVKVKLQFLRNFIVNHRWLTHRQDVVNYTTPLKEVIQPHVLVRLPCYDFTPVISLTLDGSFPCGLGHRFRVLPTPMA